MRAERRGTRIEDNTRESRIGCSRPRKRGRDAAVGVLQSSVLPSSPTNREGSWRTQARKARARLSGYRRDGAEYEYTTASLMGQGGAPSRPTLSVPASLDAAGPTHLGTGAPAVGAPTQRSQPPPTPGTCEWWSWRVATAAQQRPLKGGEELVGLGPLLLPMLLEPPRGSGDASGQVEQLTAQPGGFGAGLLAVEDYRVYGSGSAPTASSAPAPS